MKKNLVFRSLLGVALLAAGPALAAPAPAPAAPIASAAAGDTYETTLANGLKVIVKEDHRAPTIAHMVWYRAGSMDEFNGTTGVAHILEHMMFKGTKTVPPGEFSNRVAAAGGRENAFTNRDFTAYFQQIHKSRLELVMKLESDRMANLNLTDAEFAKEIKVVMEERRWRTDDQPRALLYEQEQAAAYMANPYHHPVIGWMRDLETMTGADARKWYNTWYAPNNAVLIVIGDVKAADVVALAKKYYGGIKAKTLPERKPQDEPAQQGIRRINVKAPAELPYLIMGWQVPKLANVEADTDPYALEVLAAILDGYDGARITKDLIRDQRVAHEAGAGYDSTARGPTMFSLEGVPADGKTVNDLEAALRSEVQKVADQGVTEAELKRVKAQVVAAQVYKRDSIFGQAMEIAQYEMAGISHKKIPLILDKLKAVTAEQVQAVAKKYFGDDTLTVATLTPLPITEKKGPPPKGMRSD
ncbi:MAG TPA: pitrilysin family protein [Burkholderiales bacterium]